MVLYQREPKMASDQPVKKKPRQTDSEHTADEPDYIPNNLSALHLSFPVDVNEADITFNTINAQFNVANKANRTSEQNVTDRTLVNNMFINNVQNPVVPSTPFIQSFNNMQSFADNLPTTFASRNIQPYPRENINYSQNHRLFQNVQSKSSATSINENILGPPLNDEEDFNNKLINQCLCGVSEVALRKPFEADVTGNNGSMAAVINEWSVEKILQFLSKLQLFFEVYLKQNNKGIICSKMVEVCNLVIRNEYNLIEQIISLTNKGDKYINYLSAKTLASFLIVAKTNVNNEWLESILSFLTMDTVNYDKTNFALEIIKRVVEWKDVDIHVLEETQLNQNIPGTSTQETVNTSCSTITFSDPESYDTSTIKGLLIKGLETKWPELTVKIQGLINGNSSIEANTCILTFLSLWENIISIKANLSVIDTKPFYAHLESFVCMLSSSLSPVIWKQLLSLFNEVLCYGSTLALQDMLPEDTCQLAHLIVRYVKDFRLLDHLPFRRDEGLTVHSFVGTIPSSHASQSTNDKTLLQKMVLLVLKSVAITIKETRSDSSDSSVGSDDYDFYQDMQLIERSIRDVLKKVDVFIKNSLDFHPESSFSKILLHLFSDQDDYMIESMVCTLDITVGISYRNAVFPDLIAMLNPVHSFIEFLKIVSHDSDVILDYLLSNETCFLLYLLRFLKYIRRNWSKFVSSCSEYSGISRVNELDDTMTVLIRLKIQISRLVSKELFPYNINPVLRLLEVCEGLYEGNEYS